MSSVSAATSGSEVNVEELAAQVRELRDRQAIADVYQRYARGIDRHDVELGASAYHDDAIDDHGLYIGDGRAVVEWANQGPHANVTHHLHHVTNVSVELDGDSAHVEAYFLMVSRTRADRMSLSTGRYLDRMEKRQGVWRIAARVVTVEMSSDLGVSDMEEADRAFAPSRQDEQDRSYERPLRVRRSSANDRHDSPGA